MAVAMAEAKNADSGLENLKWLNRLVAWVRARVEHPIAPGRRPVEEATGLPLTPA